MLLSSSWSPLNSHSHNFSSILHYFNHLAMKNLRILDSHLVETALLRWVVQASLSTAWTMTRAEEHLVLATRQKKLHKKPPLLRHDI